MACAPSKDPDQPGHLPSLIRVFAVRMQKAWVLSYPMSAQQRLIRLGWCLGWSKSSLGAQSFCWFCHATAHMVMVSFFLQQENYWHSPASFPGIILNNSTWLPFQCWIQSLFYLHIETVHVHKGNNSLHTDETLEASQIKSCPHISVKIRYIHFLK